MFAVILPLLLSAQAGSDIIIKNGTVVDGSGAVDTVMQWAYIRAVHQAANSARTIVRQ